MLIHMPALNCRVQLLIYNAALPTKVLKLQLRDLVEPLVCFQYAVGELHKRSLRAISVETDSKCPSVALYVPRPSPGGARCITSMQFQNVML
jgi:hypothetical protein